MSLAVPLQQSQVDAAMRLFKYLDNWNHVDNAVEMMRTHLPGLSTVEVLLKTVIVNSLFSTNVYAVQKMAAHISATLSDVDIDTVGPELVEQIALFQAKEVGNPRRCHSFASKFAHCFVNQDRFLILDDFAEFAVRRHLGKQAQTGPENRYIAFSNNVDQLRLLARLNCSVADLDKYLWLVGAWHRWETRKNKSDASKKKAGAAISSEVIRLFESTATSVRADRDLMFGVASE